MLAAPPADLTSKVLNAEEIPIFFGSDKYVGDAGIQNVKIAFIGRYFEGVTLPEDPKGDFIDGRRYLPRPPLLSTLFVYPGISPQAEKIALFPGQDRDRRLAQILWAATGYHEIGPQIKLYNGRDPENFESALADLDRFNPDIVLCTSDFPSYGNLDSSGPLNIQIENKVKHSKMIWIQKAGDNREMVFNGKVNSEDRTVPSVEAYWPQKPIPRKWLTFPQGKYLKFKVNADMTDVEITVNWNAYAKGTRARGTDKDLAVVLFKPNPNAKEKDIPGDPLVYQNIKQVFRSDLKNPETETTLAFESFKYHLEENEQPYFIGIPHLGGEFGKQDKVRVTITTSKSPFYHSEKKAIVPAIEFLDTTKDNFIMSPADTNRLWVITVGNQSPTSSYDDDLRKPDLKLDKWTAKISDGTPTLSGTDVSATYFAAQVALMKAKEPKLERRHILKLIDQTPKRERIPADPEELKKYYEAKGWVFKTADIRPQDPEFFKCLEEKEIAYYLDTGNTWTGVALKIPPYELKAFESVPQSVKTNRDKYGFTVKVEDTNVYDPSGRYVVRTEKKCVGKYWEKEKSQDVKSLEN